MEKEKSAIIDHSFDDQITIFFNLLLGENPPEAIVNICVKIEDKGLKTSSFRSVDRTAIIDAVKRLREEGNVYFETCLQREPPLLGERGKVVEKTIMLGCWMDIDVAGPNHAKDTYPSTKQEALSFIMDFTPTLVIETGGGYHSYWLFHYPLLFGDEVEREKAAKLAESIQRLIIKEGTKRGWHLDYTGDLARLMRVPGTYNYKNKGKLKVQMVHFDNEHKYNPEEFSAICETEENSEVLPTIQQARKAVDAYPSSSAEGIIEHCSFIKHCIEDAETLTEPEWFKFISVISHCTDGSALCHQYSSSYPGYTYAETQKKIENALKKGPITCEKIQIDSNAAAYCSRCPFHGHSKSPILLGGNSESTLLMLKGVKIIVGAFTDPGLPFEKESLITLVMLKRRQPETYARIRSALAKMNISVTALATATENCIYEGDGKLNGIEFTPYMLNNNCMFLVKQTQFGKKLILISNFAAFISQQIFKNNGQETVILYKIKSVLSDGTHLPEVEVSADEFKNMAWVASNYGARAIISAGQSSAEHLRVAIQTLSSDIKNRSVFAHTGWRKIGDEWLYLTSCGALGASGLLTDVGVELDDKLALYFLPGLPKEVSIQDAVCTSLKFLDLAPDTITYSLFSSIYSAPLGEVEPIDFADFLHGFTGTLKSELAGIVQSHYGAGFRGKNLPAAWSSTGNYLEKLAFLAKDAILVIDDFIPTGSPSEVASMHSKADRVLRASGNLSGRGRMATDTSLRKTYPPRCLSLCTGEDIPKGQSLRARLNLLEIKPGDVDLKLLTDLQRHASNGVLAGALSAYIQWLAPKIDELKVTFPKGKIELRDLASREVKSHLRSPEIIAYKMLGMDTFLKFAVEVKAISESQAADIRQKAWNTFCEADAIQAELQTTEDPVVRFLDLLRTALVMGLANVEEFAGGSPAKNPESWGWEAIITNSGEIKTTAYRAKGRKIGWVSGTNLYLDPDASYLTVQEIASKSGNPLPISPIVLRKRMDERGLIQQKAKGSLIKTLTIQGTKYKVLHILTTDVGNADPAPTGTPIVESTAAIGVAPEAPEITVGELSGEEDENVPDAPNFFFDPTSPDDFKEQARKAAIEQAEQAKYPYDF